jgi:putative protease
MEIDDIEILAPAGSYESLRAGIKAGCDAVYFGISDLNMRSTAANKLEVEDLNRFVEICKENDVKTYVTVNTVIYDSEVEEMHKLVDAVKESGATAIIAADMATIMYARSIGVEVHVSTQLSVSNIETVKYYSTFVDRIVLARELNLEQITYICKEIERRDIRGPSGKLMEIEIFVHGALCVAVSGRCSMSLFCSNTSANRGKCSQICRRKYKVIDEQTGNELIIDNNYVMSSADLCTIGMLDELVKSGVKSFKFEGRGRSPEYVDTVIRTYKEALKSIKEGAYTHEKIIKWNEDLGTVFNRGFTKGFFMGRPIDEWSGINGSKATKEKYQVGVVEAYYPKIQIAQVLIRDNFEVKKGDEVTINGKITGLVKSTLNEFWLNDELAQTAHQGDVITFKVESRVRKGDIFNVLRNKTLA